MSTIRAKFEGGVFKPVGLLSCRINARWNLSLASSLHRCRPKRSGGSTKSWRDGMTRVKPTLPSGKTSACLRIPERR